MIELGFLPIIGEIDVLQNFLIIVIIPILCLIAYLIVINIRTLRTVLKLREYYY